MFSSTVINIHEMVNVLIDHIDIGGGADDHLGLEYTPRAAGSEAAAAAAAAAAAVEPRRIHSV